MKGHEIDEIFARAPHGEDGPAEVIVTPADGHYEPAGYLAQPFMALGNAVLGCVRCGGLVPDTQECRLVHDEFHEALDEFHEAFDNLSHWVRS